MDFRSNMTFGPILDAIFVLMPQNYLHNSSVLQKRFCGMHAVPLVELDFQKPHLKTQFLFSVSEVGFQKVWVSM